MDTVISVIVLIVAICSIISAFAKKKPERDRRRLPPFIYRAEACSEWAGGRAA